MKVSLKSSQKPVLAASICCLARLMFPESLVQQARSSLAWPISRNGHSFDAKVEKYQNSHRERHPPPHRIQTAALPDNVAFRFQFLTTNTRLLF